MTLLFQAFIEKYKNWASESVNKYFLQIIKTVLICLFVAFAFHMVFIQITQRDIMISDAMHDNNTQAELFEDKMSMYKSLAIASARDITVYASDRSVKGIMQVIENLEDSGYFTYARYIDERRKVYLSNGSVLEMTEDYSFDELRRLDFPEGAAIVMSIEIDGERSMNAVAPVKNRSGMVRGFVIGRIKLVDEKMVETLDAELNDDAVFFVVDGNGEVALQSDGNLIDADFSNLNNIYTFLDGFDVYEDSLVDLRNMRKDKGNGYCEVKTSQGNMLLFYTTLERVNGSMKFISLMPYPKFGRLLKSMEYSQVLLIMFDLVVVFIMALLLSYLIHHGEVKLDRIAYRDNITAARSKIYLRMESEKLLKEMGKDNWMLIALDIAGFRYVNELYGRERGDEVLKVLADSLLEVMGKNEILARNTADMFEILVYYQSDWKRRLNAISHKVRSFARTVDIAVPIKIRAGGVRITASDYDFALLLDKANSARKSIGPDSDEIFAMYNVRMQEAMILREEIEAAQEQALAHDEFKLYLQPKFDIATGKLSGAESLVRWIRRDGKMVFPDQFIPVFEENSFIEKIDHHMMEMTLELQQRLINEGIKPVPISVNQSRILLLKPGYVDKVRELYNKYEFDNSLVEIEITETVFADDKSTIIDVMKELHEMGCAIDMDDFGSGYSSLNTLREMPFDVLKIDREFFDESNSEQGKTILSHIVAMANDLGMKTVCEGVETREDEALLKSIGCTNGQGYLYSRPIPAEEFVQKFIYDAIFNRGELYLVSDAAFEGKIKDFWDRSDMFYAEPEEEVVEAEETVSDESTDDSVEEAIDNENTDDAAVETVDNADAAE